MYVLFTRTLKTEYTKSSSLTNDRVPVLCTSTTNNLFYKLYRRRDRYSKQKSRMNRDEHPAFVPMLKTVEQMAVVSGIGENRLRQLMDNGELEFIQNGNRRLISEQAIWDYYNRAKTPARSVSGGC